MPSLDEVYRKFGEAAEAAQLLETELGTNLVMIRAVEDSLLSQPDQDRAADILRTINRHTLGQILKHLNGRIESLDKLEFILWDALQERNRLFHSFYRQHNFRRNSDEGRALMLDDLERIHQSLLTAFKAVMLLSGIDLESAASAAYSLPTRHVPI